jgi:fructosamine-3-kinase
MDLAYLRSHPQHLPTFLTHQRIRETPVATGISAASRLTLDDGNSVFVKSLPDHPPGFFAAEAAGLAWLGEAGGAPVPEVIGELDDMLVLEWIDPGEPTPAAAERFGRELAVVHRAGAPAFGADWPGYIGRLPMDNTPSTEPWPVWFGERRLRPYLKISADRGALSAADVALVEGLLSRIDQYGGSEPPARIHGDLWPGNLLWATDGRAWLVDPAAHGGHRETDLALLGLFGSAPYLDRILAAYQEEWPLADGWQDRIPLHQLYLLLVHTAMFGSAYRQSVMAAVNSLL